MLRTYFVAGSWCLWHRRINFSVKKPILGLYILYKLYLLGYYIHSMLINQIPLKCKTMQCHLVFVMLTLKRESELFLSHQIRLNCVHYNLCSLHLNTFGFFRNGPVRRASWWLQPLVFQLCFFLAPTSTVLSEFK